MEHFNSVLAAASRDETVPSELREKLRGGDGQMVLEALLGIGLKAAGLHAMVFSMMRREHLEANVKAVEKCRFSEDELGVDAGKVVGSGLV